MATFKMPSRVTHRSLMNKSEAQFVFQVLGLLNEFDRERARREQPEPSDTFGADIAEGIIGRVDDR